MFQILAAYMFQILVSGTATSEKHFERDCNRNKSVPTSFFQARDIFSDSVSVFA